MIKSILSALVIAYVILAAGMFAMQRKLIYFPDPKRTMPADAALPDVTERVIETPDGEKIIAWYGKAKPHQPTLLYFHGNGGSLESRRERIAKYMARGRGVFMMAYRGYSGSTGSPSEAANVADAKLAYDTLIKDGVKADEIILYGESLGSGVAAQVAAEKPVRGLILDSPYTAVVDRAAEIYWWLPVRALVIDSYETRHFIKSVTAPLFILHGEIDDVVPTAMGRKVFELANEPKEMVVLPGAGHNNHWQFGSLEAINAWIDRLWAGDIKTGQARA